MVKGRRVETGVEPGLGGVKGKCLSTRVVAAACERVRSPTSEDMMNFGMVNRQ